MPKDIIDEESKTKYLSALTPEMVSSEDEHEDENGSRYFMVHQLKSWTKKFRKLLKITDDAYSKNCSHRSKEQLIRREIGAPTKRPPPKGLPYGLGELFLEWQY